MKPISVELRSTADPCVTCGAGDARDMVVVMPLIGARANGPVCRNCWDSLYQTLKKAPQGVEIVEFYSDPSPPEGK